MKLSVRLGYRALRWSAVFGLIALLLMVWGVVVPSPISLVIAMSVGQALGTLSFGVFLLVVLADLRRSRVFARVFSSRPTRLSSAPPPSDPAP